MHPASGRFQALLLIATSLVTVTSTGKALPRLGIWRFWGWAQTLEQTTLGECISEWPTLMDIVNKLLLRKHGALKHSLTLNMTLLVKTWLRTSARTWKTLGYVGLFLGISMDSAGRRFCCTQCILCSQGLGGVWIFRGRGESALWNPKADAWLQLEQLWC